MNFDQNFTTLNCTFLNTWPPNGQEFKENKTNYYSCSIVYGIHQSQVASGISLDSNVVVLYLDVVQGEQNFTITANNGSYKAYIEGTINGIYSALLKPRAINLYYIPLLLVNVPK